MAMEIVVVDSCMVTPSEETPKHGIWLSNLDLLVARSHTPTIYIYRSSSDRPAATLLSPEILKVALSKALVPFYPLAGRLAENDAGRPEIRCTGDGVLFVTARADAALDDLGGFAPSDELRRMLVPCAEAGGDAGILAMFQVTFFRCGGACLGAALHHTAVDGLAALDFVNAWAAIARGVAGEPAASPYLDRTLLRARSPPAVLFDHAEYSRRASGGSKRTVPFDSAVLPMSKDQLDKLKGGAGDGKKLSTFKAVAAHVWRCACRARGLVGTDDTRLYMTGDARSRVHPPLPAGYFGNAIFRASAVAKVNDIASGPVDATAEKISTATTRLDDEYVRSLVDYLDLQAVDAAGLRKGEWVMPETDLWVISWQGLPIYGADFGWGRPAFMGRACLQFSGLVYLVPGPDADGCLDVVVAMEPESLARFKELMYQELDGTGNNPQHEGSLTGPGGSPILHGRVAIVTGGAGGIGAAVTSHLASLGARVVVGYVGDPAPANELVTSLNAATATPACLGPRAVAVAADVSDPAQVAALFDAARAAFGGAGEHPHILVAAAGFQDSAYPAIADTDPEQWDRTFAVNARGTFLCCREAARRLVRGGGGRIVTFSSSNVGSLRPGYGAYVATKAAVEAMTKVLAKELAGTGITANSVAPGPVATPMFYAGKSEERVRAVARECPMQRIGEPADVAPVVGFLCSDAAGWINGQVIRVNGGYV